MNFTEIANTRQSCRSYDSAREVEKEKLNAILKCIENAVIETQKLNELKQLYLKKFFG